MQTTETPRTDFESGLAECQNTKGDDRVPANFARQLERELNQAKADIVELNQRLIERREAYEAYCAKIAKKNHPLPELVAKVLQWGIDRHITGPNGKGTLMAQSAKVLEEAQETYEAAQILCNDGTKAELKDGIGDVAVTIILLAEMAGMTLTECLQAAYDEIKGRTGKMEGGTFIKSK